LDLDFHAEISRSFICQREKSLIAGKTSLVLDISGSPERAKNPREMMFKLCSNVCSFLCAAAELSSFNKLVCEFHRSFIVNYEFVLSGLVHSHKRCPVASEAHAIKYVIIPCKNLSHVRAIGQAAWGAAL
jgi:hypothetical protein